MFSIYSVLLVQICTCLITTSSESTSAIYHNTDAHDFLRAAWRLYDKDFLYDENVDTSPSEMKGWWLDGIRHENEDEVPLHKEKNEDFEENPITLRDLIGGSRHENEDEVPLQEKENEDFKGSPISLRNWIGGSRHANVDEVPLQEKENEDIEQRPITFRDLIDGSMHENEDEVPFHEKENEYFKENPITLRDLIGGPKHENEDEVPLRKEKNDFKESTITFSDLFGSTWHENEDEVPIHKEKNEDFKESPIPFSDLFGGTWHENEDDMPLHKVEKEDFKDIHTKLSDLLGVTWHENAHEVPPQKEENEDFEKELIAIMDLLGKTWHAVEEPKTRKDSKEEFPDINFGDLYGETTHDDNETINRKREENFEDIAKLCSLFLDEIIAEIAELEQIFEESSNIDIWNAKPSFDNTDHFSSEDGGILILIPGTMHETSLESTTESSAEDVEIEKHSTEEKENPKEPEIVETSLESTTEYSTEYEDKENHPKGENEYTEEPEIVESSFESTTEPSTEYVDIEMRPKEEKEYPEIVESQETYYPEFHNYIPNYGGIDRYSYKTKGDGNYLSESQVHIYPEYINLIPGGYKLEEKKLDKVKREAPITNDQDGFLADQPIAVEEHIEKKKTGNVEFGRGNSDRSQLIGKFLTELDKETGGGQTKYNVGPSFSHPVTTTEKSFWKKLFDLL
ncbi:uncharacterized protein LOC106665224 isoform X3 [Cimex lectularius]|uniref:Uncharacterized protein n=1 Tax=Cimex lectularius TaxID=79782 RepID=A0A8I6RIS5_CIMLE|nr:uncharacterized protein LOC106665224 isoform X3 [Cimex lectularius]